MNSRTEVILWSWTEALSESDQAGDSDFPYGTNVSWQKRTSENQFVLIYLITENFIVLCQGGISTTVHSAELNVEAALTLLFYICWFCQLLPTADLHLNILDFI
jgi:hypothetical protein